MSQGYFRLVGKTSTTLEISILVLFPTLGPFDFPSPVPKPSPNGRALSKRWKPGTGVKPVYVLAWSSLSEEMFSSSLTLATGYTVISSFSNCRSSTDSYPRRPSASNRCCGLSKKFYRALPVFFASRLFGLPGTGKICRFALRPPTIDRRTRM